MLFFFFTDFNYILKFIFVLDVWNFKHFQVEVVLCNF